MSQVTKKGDAGPGFRKPCREYEQCNHKKHGYGKRRRHEVERARKGRS